MVTKIVYLCFILTVFAFYLSPTFIFDDIALGNKTPETVHYLLWLAGINVFDVAFGGMAILALTNLRLSRCMLMLFGLLLLMFVWGATLQYINSHGYFYFDGVISFLRLVYALILGAWITQSGRLHDAMRVTTLAVFLNALVTITAFYEGAHESVLSGRTNLMGFGPNGSGEIIFFHAFFLIFVERKWAKWKKLAVLSAFILYVPLSGGRRFLAALFGLIMLAFKSRKHIALNILSIVFSFAILVFLFLNVEIIARIFEGTELSAISRLADTVSLLQQGNLQDGRSDMYNGAWSVIFNFPMGLGISDWRIQEELSKYTVGSHTHNAFLQFYLKFGVFGIMFLILILAWALQRLLKKGVEWWFLFLVVLISINTGYGLWNQKIQFFYFFALGSFTISPSRIGQNRWH